jgi:hypothetical protein
MNADSIDITADHVNDLRDVINDMLKWQDEDNYRDAFSTFSPGINNNRRALFDGYLRELSGWMKAGYKKKVRETLLRIRDQWTRIKDFLKPDIIPKKVLESMQQRMEATLETMIRLCYLKPKRKNDPDSTDPSQPPPGRKRISHRGRGGQPRARKRQASVARTGDFTYNPFPLVQTHSGRGLRIAGSSGMQSYHSHQGSPPERHSDAASINPTFSSRQQYSGSQGGRPNRMNLNAILSGDSMSQATFTTGRQTTDPTPTHLAPSAYSTDSVNLTTLEFYLQKNPDSYFSMCPPRT